MTHSRQLTGVFTPAEVDYLRNVHPLARIATVGSDGTPHVMPTGSYDLDLTTGTITSTGMDLARTKKWRDIEGNGKAAIVFDEVLTPFRPRGLEIRGDATTETTSRPAIRIWPRRIVSWGLEPGSGGRRSRDVGTSP